MHTLYCTDCLDVLPTMQEASVDVIITSPSRNLGIDYSSYGDCKSEIVTVLLRISIKKAGTYSAFGLCSLVKL